MNSKQRFRARIILILILVGAGILGSTLYSIQIVKGKTYSTQARKQYVKPSSTVYDRGTIFFATKDGTHPAAATIASGYVIFINPSLIVDAGQTYDALIQYMDLDLDEFKRKANQKTDPYEELAHRVDEKTAQSIAALKIKGVGMSKETWRSYPGAELASHTLGLVGEGADMSIVGKYGLERSYDDVLTRQGGGTSLTIFAQLFSGFRDSVFGASGEGDIVTSIEPTVEGYLEKTLAKTAAEWKPDEIGGIIIDPRTGLIVAMASLPTYDPNDLTGIKNPAIFSNSIVENVYEMGSIMKPLTMATGLDSGAITPKSTYDDTGTLTLSGKKISNFDGRARGIIPMQEVLSQSLNVGAATIALKVGKDAFAKYFMSYGLGEKTAIDQPNEATGLVTNLKTGRDIEIATAAYGQGIAVSPIAMTRALSVLANGGMLIKPHLVTEISHTNGSTEPISSADGVRVLKKESVDAVTTMLIKVVDEALKKGGIKMEHYSVAAKTGTAQIPDHKNGGYYTDRYLHSFFGYFPAYNPKYLVFLYQTYPKGAQYASETLTDPFSQITKFLIDYYNIPPDR